MATTTHELAERATSDGNTSQDESARAHATGWRRWVPWVLIVLAATILLALFLRGRRDPLFLRAAGAFLTAIAIWSIAKLAIAPDDYISGVLASAAYRFIDISNLEQPVLFVLLGVLWDYMIAVLVLRRFAAAANALICSKFASERPPSPRPPIRRKSRRPRHPRASRIRSIQLSVGRAPGRPRCTTATGWRGSPGPRSTCSAPTWAR